MVAASDRDFGAGLINALKALTAIRPREAPRQARLEGQSGRKRIFVMAITARSRPQS